MTWGKDAMCGACVSCVGIACLCECARQASNDLEERRIVWCMCKLCRHCLSV